VAVKSPKKVERNPKKEERLMAGKERHWPAVSGEHPRKTGGLAVPAQNGGRRHRGGDGWVGKEPEVSHIHQQPMMAKKIGPQNGETDCRQ
jgi:hypothetical protein